MAQASLGLCSFPDIPRVMGEAQQKGVHWRCRRVQVICVQSPALMPTAVLNIFGFFPWLNFFNFFNDAHHFVVERLTSISALFVTYIEAPKQDNTHIYRERLAGYVVTSALHDAGQTPLSRCLPETRVKVQEDMKNWIADIPVNGQPKTRFLWLTGPAGVGKTAIIGTIADRCKEERTLAASFFFSTFSGGPYRQSKARFISTLAYQLLNCVPEIEKKVLAAIERDPVIFDRGLDEQFRALILEPLRETVEESDSDPSIWRKIIFVDGLDECTAIQDPSASPKELRERTEAAHREILSVLFSAIKEPSFPFRIVLASRPEQVICQFFSTQKQWHIELFLDEKYNPSDDIKRFLEAKFHEIQQRYDLPDNWVPQSVIQLLVERASGQFIFAMVAIRFVEDGDELPQDQVQLLLRWCPEPSQLSESKPFDALDQLYTRILKTSPKHYLAIKWILAIDRLRREAPCPPAIVKDYLESAAGETQFLLGRLNSLVHVSKRNSDLPLFHLHHQSLLDFLADPRRSGDLYVGEDKVEEFLRGCWENILKSRGPHRCSGQYTAIPKDFVDWYFRLSSYQPTQVSETDMEWWDTAMGTRETVILLLGRSGAGKSHFINGLAGADLAPVSDCLLPPRDHFKASTAVIPTWMTAQSSCKQPNL
ncbi:hypothetical protein FA13DRAFT_370346 [Coprinellus micaceus]|uniref:NACHT domain-containing protein n=1 Tax=Coprinellus micaceus TaxID=71717 RepID=A0A4Y7SEL1_COPMI|nr:hypothetical protein FA13DRAFT_370346 [Coprinellus micaceus]